MTAPSIDRLAHGIASRVLSIPPGMFNHPDNRRDATVAQTLHRAGVSEEVIHDVLVLLAQPESYWFPRD